jgi:hypothetical protein
VTVLVFVAEALAVDVLACAVAGAPPVDVAGIQTWISVPVRPEPDGSTAVGSTVTEMFALVGAI